MSSSLRYLSLNPYELHKHLINTYVLQKKGATSLLKRDTSRDKTDLDVIRENHKFLWEDDEQPITWEERLAKKYYDKLFKEFCIADLSRYKENMFAMRWQTENELVIGKGQFICGNKICCVKCDLKTWEVNFGYIEHGEKKNALVKLRLCDSCSGKLNYRKERKEIKRLKRPKNYETENVPSANEDSNKEKQGETLTSLLNTSEIKNPEEVNEAKEEIEKESDIWKAPVEDVDEPSRDQEFEKYLEHLLL